MDSVALNGTADFTDEVLAANGLSNAVNTATLVQDSNTGNTILMPHTVTRGLEPPSIDDEEEVEAPSNEDFENSSLMAEAMAEFEDAINEEQHSRNNNSVEDSAIFEEIPNTEEYTHPNTDMAQEYPATPEEAVNVRAALEAIMRDEEDSELHEEVAEETNALIATANSVDAIDLAMQEAVGDAVNATNNTKKPLTAKEMIDLLPENPKSLLAVDETTSRFSGAAWYKAVQQSTIILAGLGGIGGYVLFLLSRMKPQQVFIYDDDIVEMANLSGQLYSKSMVGKKKVNAMAELAGDFSDYHGVMAIDSRWDETKNPGDIMICGFDNMQARECFFRSWLRHLIGHKHPENCLFIDGRLSAEEMQIFCIQGTDKYNIDRYNSEYLFSDYEADATICSLKQTSYCANMIGSVIVNLYTNFIANTLHPIMDRDLPFKTYYDASMMFFKTEN